MCVRQVCVNQIHVKLLDPCDAALHGMPRRVIFDGQNENMATQAPQAFCERAFVGTNAADLELVLRQIFNERAHMLFHTTDNRVADNFEHMQLAFGIWMTVISVRVRQGYHACLFTWYFVWVTL